MNLFDLKLFLTVTCVAVAGCGTTVTYAETQSPPRPMSPRPASAVAVFTSGAPDADYAEVGIIQGRQTSDYSLDDLPEIIAEMRERAGEEGCHGIVINGRSDKTHAYGHGSRGHYHYHQNTLEGVVGTCIVFLDRHEAGANRVVPSTQGAL